MHITKHPKKDVNLKNNFSAGPREEWALKWLMLKIIVVIIRIIIFFWAGANPLPRPLPLWFLTL